MASKAQRREPRIDISLPVTLQLPDGELNYSTSNASYRGIFINCPDPLPLRKLVRFQTELSEGDDPLQMLGLVAHTVNPTDAHEGGVQPGMGIQLYSVGKGTLERWRAFIAERYNQDPQARNQVQTMDADRVSIHLNTIGEVEAFAEDKLNQESVFVRTSELNPIDSTVICEVFHPDADVPFELESRVIDVKETPRRQRGMRVKFPEVDDDLRDEFQAFIDQLCTEPTTP